MAEAQDIEVAQTSSHDVWVAPLMNIDQTITVDDLLKVYDDLLAFLAQDDYDEDLISEINEAFSIDYMHKEKKACKTQPESQRENNWEGNPEDIPKPLKYLQVFEMRKTDLGRLECGITIAGDASSGKTSLLNKLAGQKLVTPKVRATTCKICRVTNSCFCAIECLDKNGIAVKKREFFQNVREMTPKLNSYTDFKTNDVEVDKYYYIDVKCPLQNLKVEENVMVVDTPGIGETDKLTEMLMDILPNAVAFIFVIDVTRAGGVQEHGLVQILKAIVKARNQMPCFNPKDVLFVTNKWNSLTEEAKQNESEELWDLIFDKLNNVWPHLRKEQIFKLNLSKETADCGSEEEIKEFRRFTGVLSRILSRTKSTRVEMHICLLKDTIRVIERGIEARIRTANSDVENKEGQLDAMSTKLEILHQTCNEIVEELANDMERSKKQLVDKLHNYINSSKGRDEILNPVGEKPLEDFFFPGTEIQPRFQKGIMQWMRGKDVADEMEKIDQKISKKFREIHLELEQVQTCITGQDSTHDDSRVSTVLKFVFTAPLWLPFCIVLGSLALVIAVLSSPLIVGYALLSNKSMKRTVIEQIYSQIAQRLTKNDMRKDIDELFENHFEQRIKLIFEEELPREIANTKSIITYLSYQRDRIVENLDTYLRLRDTLLTLKDSLQKLDKKSY